MFGRWKKPIDRFELLDGDYLCIKRGEGPKLICQLQRDPKNGNWQLVNRHNGDVELDFVMPDILEPTPHPLP